MTKEKNLKKINKRYSLITVVLAVVVVVLINFLAQQLFWRFDLTQDKIYSLSQASKDLMKNLDEKITISVYFSSKLPAEYQPVSDEVKDLLSEYQNYSNNKMKVEYIDPKDDEELKQQLKRKGIPELQFNVMEKDQFQLTNGYLGIAVSYLDKEEVIPVVQDVGSFEYELSSVIKKVISSEPAKIAWLTTSDKYDQVLPELQKDYDIVKVNMEAPQILDGTYKSMVVIGGEKEIDTKNQFVIDQFLMSGGSVLFLSDGINVDQSLQSTPSKNGLDDLLASWGLEVKKELVLDTISEMANFSGGYMTFMVQYPYWVKATKDSMAQDQAVVSKLESVVFPWSSYIAVNKEKTGANEIVELIKSSKKSWLSGSNINLDPQNKVKPTTYSQYPLVIMDAGSFTSYFKDKEIPLDNKDIGKIDSTEKARLVVVADADCISDQFASQYQDNLVFFSNMLDWLNQDEGLIAIRSKGVTDRPLHELTDSQKTSIKYGNIFGITAIVIIIGLARMIIRRKKFKKIKFKL